MSGFAINLDVKSGSDIKVKAPFAISNDDGRSFVRIEFAEAVEFCLIKEGDSFYPATDEQKRSGATLNVSTGGALIESDELVPEGAIISLKMIVADEIHLSSVLAVVKRVEQLDDTGIIGVEFLTHERLADFLSGPEMELLDCECGYFAERLQATLQERVETNG